MNWKKVLGGLAPTIATAVGGPFAGMATRFVSEALLGKPDGDDREINAFLKANPNKIIDLKIAEAKLKKELDDNDIDLAEIDAQDRENARARQIALRDKTPNYLAYIVTALYAAVIAALIFVDVPEQARDMLNIMFGTLSAVWIMCVKYFVGTSSSSRAKDERRDSGG
jgi:hypothetical protein